MFMRKNANLQKQITKSFEQLLLPSEELLLIMVQYGPCHI